MSRLKNDSTSHASPRDRSESSLLEAWACLSVSSWRRTASLHFMLRTCFFGSLSSLGNHLGEIRGHINALYKQHRREGYQCTKNACKKDSSVLAAGSTLVKSKHKSSKYFLVSSIRRPVTFDMACPSTLDHLSVTDSSNWTFALCALVALGITITSRSGPRLQLLGASRTP